ncbi:MAG: cell division protein FtsQ/DivIB [Pseudomonadales bacterium]|jgi:cell division protein FtsQ
MNQLPIQKLLISILIALSLSVGTYFVSTAAILEVNEVAVAGEVTEAQQAALYELMQEEQLLGESMARIQARLEQIGWIHRAALSRRWPETLVVTVDAEKPIALWNDDAYLNEQGVVFHSPFVNQSRLPQLYGPQGQEELVMAQYLQLNSMLFQGGQHIEQLTLDDRGNWRFKSNLDIEVLLGKAALMERMQRLLQVVEHIGSQRDLNLIKQIDTRYVNGAAVAWHKQGVVAQTVATEIKMASNYNSQREPKL